MGRRSTTECTYLPTYWGFQVNVKCFSYRFGHFLGVLMSSGDPASPRWTELTPWAQYMMKVYTSAPNISLARPITALGSGPQRHFCGQLWSIQNRGLTCGPHHSQIQGRWVDTRKVCSIQIPEFRTYLGPSRTSALFAPAMSVRVFGYFRPFFIFLTQGAPCSAPPCTPDAWTSRP